MAKVLVIDDSQELLELFSILLATKGYEVETANSGNKALNKLSVFVPDIILLDVKLDGEDGRELCKEIREKNPVKHIPIILVSGDPELLVHYDGCNSDAIIEKPFRMDIVMEKINELLTKTKSTNRTFK